MARRRVRRINPLAMSIGQATYGSPTSTYDGGSLRRPRIGDGLAQGSSGSFASSQPTIGSIGQGMYGDIGNQPTIGSIGQATYGSPTSTYGGTWRRPRIGDGLAQASSGSFASSQPTIGSIGQGMYGDIGNQPTIGNPLQAMSIGQGMYGDLGGPRRRPRARRNGLAQASSGSFASGQQTIGNPLQAMFGNQPTIGTAQQGMFGLRRGFRGQSGVSTTGFYEAGVQAAQAAFEAGGVNALLSFLAGFNSGQ